MKLLHVIQSANPSEGGPIEGVRQRGVYLVRHGHLVELATLDDPAASHLGEFPLKVHALGPSRGRYGYSPKLVPWLAEHARDYDAVVAHGIWQYGAFAAWRTLRNSPVPYYVFTHGMLDPWFKRSFPLKHLKKWLYWPWGTYRLLRDARAVLFTTEEERIGARKSFWLYSARERVVAYGTHAPPEERTPLRERFFAHHAELGDKRILLFLGRIHPKKGCDLLLRALAGAVAIEPRLHLVIAGPDQGWRPALEALAADLGILDRVTWSGLVRDESKWGAFYASEAFVLPSHQENFGIAVAEALGCGLPVLISNKVNIWHEVQDAGAGLVAPDTAAGTEQLLIEWLRLDESSRDAMGRRARELFLERFSIRAMAEGLLSVIRTDLADDAARA